MRPWIGAADQRVASRSPRTVKELSTSTVKSIVVPADDSGETKMDRREALRKLAIGGALAAGGSMVLSSNNVAFAASAEPLSGIPTQGQSLPVAPSSSASSGTVTLSYASQAVCASGDRVETTYAWRINGFVLKKNGSEGMFLTSGGTTIRAASGNTCIGCPAPSSGAYVAGTGTATIQPLGKNAKFQKGDSYNVGLLVTWACPHRTVSAEFALTGAFREDTGTQALMVPGTYANTITRAST